MWVPIVNARSMLEVGYVIISRNLNQNQLPSGLTMDSRKFFPLLLSTSTLRFAFSNKENFAVNDHALSVFSLSRCGMLMNVSYFFCATAQRSSNVIETAKFQELQISLKV